MTVIPQPPKLRTTPPWPPAWNPFEVFLLTLSLVSSIGLLRGHSGSALLDERLSDFAVTLWGTCLMAGSGLALAGVYCYRKVDTLMPGLYLERAGLTLVGAAATAYSYVVLQQASDVDGVRWAITVQIAYAAACWFRAWQGHLAIRRAHQIVGVQPWRDRLLSLRRAAGRPAQGDDE